MLLGLLPGTLDVLILKAVAVAPNHGYGVARWVREATDDELIVEDGALYTALHRLEQRGLLRSEWKPSETNRRAKYYTLTAKGRRVLDEQTLAWRRSAGALFKALDRTPLARNSPARVVAGFQAGRAAGLRKASS